MKKTFQQVVSKALSPDIRIVSGPSELEAFGYRFKESQDPCEFILMPHQGPNWEKIERPVTYEREMLGYYPNPEYKKGREVEMNFHPGVFRREPVRLKDIERIIKAAKDQPRDYCKKLFESSEHCVP